MALFRCGHGIDGTVTSNPPHVTRGTLGERRNIIHYIFCKCPQLEHFDKLNSYDSIQHKYIILLLLYVLYFCKYCIKALLYKSLSTLLV